ncbi:MAG: hypothetical protein KC457_30890, partial [Myxococcales bacterium]|nr:hypothetical protein [Myxococcales bacterium]
DAYGLGHVGLLGRGLLADMRGLGVDTARLDASAEAYIRMWERAEERAGALTAPGGMLSGR